MRFTERQEFSGDPSEVWKRVSDLEAIPIYWHGTKELKVTRSGEKTTADVVFAFGGKGKTEIALDHAGMTLTIEYLEGPFRGRQKVAVKDGAVEAEWDVAFKGPSGCLGLGTSPTSGQGQRTP